MMVKDGVVLKFSCNKCFKIFRLYANEPATCPWCKSDLVKSRQRSRSD